MTEGAGSVMTSGTGIAKADAELMNRESTPEASTAGDCVNAPFMPEVDDWREIGLTA